MLPNRSQWKLWGASRRISYVSQFAAIVTLLATVVFSWLSWREARLARQDQAQYFIAEKAPRAEIADVSLHAGLITLTLVNRGESLARNVHAQLSVSRSDASIVFGDETMRSTEHTIRTGETAITVLAVVSTVVDIAGFTPTKLKPYVANPDSQQYALLHISLRYQDVLGNNYGHISSFIALK